MIEVGRALRARAEELGLSDTEVARRSGLDVGRYGNYVRGAREPDFQTFLRICRVLLTTPNAILGVEEPPKMEQDEVLAAFAALDADGRTLALKLIRAMVEHQVLREI
ncbi:helix-turn-helix domain-containing protein [Azospirillum argentinense]|uniref:helix-turn-helix domain-containing protein n=1 Tax=Azospirillum argentinense TaxID=2970906 RepID=UPI001FFF3415|nr:helix-turn-helix transcriptional regulator [Azospirillum argentinense]